MMKLNGQPLTLEDVKKIASGSEILLGNSIKKGIVSSRNFVEEIAHHDKPYYGINTGFGYLANTKVKSSDLKKLQHNIITSHAAGWGKPLTIPETRLSMALRLNVLIKGYTGVRYELCEKLLEYINKGVYPIIPSHGSVGASGDLAPLAHLALPLIGEGHVVYQGKVIEAKKALKMAHIEPIELCEKEGLSLINGTQIMLSIGSLALIQALKLMEAVEVITALTYEGLVGNINALHPKLHAVRQQEGQKLSAEAILNHLKGSYLFDTTTERSRVQDPYSMRCAPQVHGTSRDALSYVKMIIERELNAVTDNPLVFVEDELVVGGGNFHGQPLAMAYDFASIAVSELSNISERRLELLLNPNMNGLTPFLSPDPGVDSGYMAAQYLSASLVNENKLLANPACTDSIPGNVGVEDHVSMGMNSAKKFKTIVRNTITVLSVEMVVAAQAISLRNIKKLGKGTKALYAKIREDIEPWGTESRTVSEDVEKSRNILTNMIEN